jgi:hypothetical protein
MEIYNDILDAINLELTNDEAMPTSVSANFSQHLLRARDLGYNVYL